MAGERAELEELKRLEALEAKAGGAAPSPSPKPAAPQAALPEQPSGDYSTSRFISGNLMKGFAGMAGMPMDTMLNIKDLLAAGVGTVQGLWGGNMPDLTDRSRVPLSGAWNESMLRRAGAITPDSDPTSGPGRYAATALQMAPSAAMGRPTPQQLPRALGTTTTAGVATEALRDVGDDRLAAFGGVLTGLRKPPTKGEQGQQDRLTRDFAKAKDLGVPIPPRQMKIDKPRQKIEDRINADLKFPEGTELSPETLRNFNKAHWDAYDRLATNPALSRGVTPNQRFQREIQTIGTELNEARANLPETFKSAGGVLKLLGEYGYAQLPGRAGQGVQVPPRAQPIPANVAVRAIKKLRSDATTNFASDKPEQVELAHIQKKVATALENLIEDNLSQTGNQALVNEYRDARTMIAKGHDVLAAIDPRTGKVSPERLASLQADRPLSGGLKQASDVSRAFPGAVKEPADTELFTKRMSPTGVGHPKAMGAHFLQRMSAPVTMSRPYQNFMVDPRSRLSPEAEIAVRMMMATQGANRGVPTPPQ